MTAKKTLVTAKYMALNEKKTASLIAMNQIVNQSIEATVKKEKAKQNGICNCWGCQDMAYLSGMCWYHYQEEFYLSR